MYPIATVWRLGAIEHPITSYGLAVAFAILVTAGLAARSARRIGVPPLSVLAAIGFGTTGGALGAVSLHYLVEAVRQGDLTTALAGPPGFVFNGGAIGAGLTTALVARPLAVPFLPTLDAAAHVFPLGHAIGRVGCFLGGCCFGRPWDGLWAVRATHPLAAAAHPPVPRHPTALYEAVGLLVIAFVLHRSWPVRPGNVGSGRRFATYALAYAVLRFLIEGFRGDAVRGVLAGGVLSTSRIVSIVLGVAAAAWLLAAPRPSPVTPNRAGVA